MSALTQLSLQLPAQPAKRGAPKANAITSPNMLWDAAAACAYVYPFSVNGVKTNYADPWANDQDWGLYYYLKYGETWNR